MKNFRGHLNKKKNKNLKFSKFDLKLPYPASIAAKPYPKDYISPKFKQFNGKTCDVHEHMMKFLETFGMAGLDDDLKLKDLPSLSLRRHTPCMLTLFLALWKHGIKCASCLERNFFHQ